MVRRSDAGKDAEWRKRFERFRRSGLTVARFCDGERVSVASFYYWRKKLGQTAPRRRTRSRPGVFRPVTVIPATRAVAAATSAGVPASSRIVIQLPCGTRIEVGAEHLDAVRAVVGEVARAHGGLQAGIRSC